MIQNIDVAAGREVVIRDIVSSRSLAQNALYWVWVTELGNYIGEGKIELHRRLKRDILIPIYSAYDEEFAKTIDALRGVYRHDKQLGLKLLDDVARLVSTRDASVNTFAEYLREVENHARVDCGFILPHPDDYCFAVYGKRRS